MPNLPGAFKNFAISQENTCVKVTFQALETFRPATLLNRDFSTGDFL